MSNKLFQKQFQFLEIIDYYFIIEQYITEILVFHSKICRIYLVAPKYQIIDINKQQVKDDDKRYRLNPNQFVKEKISLLNLYCENQAIRIPGTKIAIECQRNLNIDQYNPDDLMHIAELANNFIIITKKVLQDNVRQDLIYNSIQLNQQNIQKLSHKQKLILLCELASIRSECKKILNANEQWNEYIKNGFQYQSTIKKNTKGFNLSQQNYSDSQSQSENNQTQTQQQEVIQPNKDDLQISSNEVQQKHSTKQYFTVDQFIQLIRKVKSLQEIKEYASKTKFNLIEDEDYVYNNLTPILQLLVQLDLFTECIILLTTLQKLLGQRVQITPLILCQDTYGKITDENLKQILIEYYTFLDEETKKKLYDNIIKQLNNYIQTTTINKHHFEKYKDLYKRLNGVRVYQMILKYTNQELIQKQAAIVEQMKNKYFLLIKDYLNITNQFLLQLPMRKQYRNKYRSVDEFLRNYVSSYQQYRQPPPMCIKQQRDFVQEAIDMQGQYQKGDRLLPEYRKIKTYDQIDNYCLQQVQQDISNLEDQSQQYDSKYQEMQVLQNIKQNVKKDKQRKNIRLPQWHSGIMSQMQSDLSRTQQSLSLNQSQQKDQIQNIPNHQEIIDKVSQLITKELIQQQTQSLVEDQISKL